jgi:hypothetical protein
MPAHAVHLARHRGILGREPAGVDPDELVAGEAADQQLVVEARPEPARLYEVDAGKR